MLTRDEQERGAQNEYWNGFDDGMASASKEIERLTDRTKALKLLCTEFYGALPPEYRNIIQERYYRTVYDDNKEGQK